jgi:hypothetical protein
MLKYLDASPPCRQAPGSLVRAGATASVLRRVAEPENGIRPLVRLMNTG